MRLSSNIVRRVVQMVFSAKPQLIGDLGGRTHGIESHHLREGEGKGKGEGEGLGDVPHARAPRTEKRARSEPQPCSTNR